MANTQTGKQQSEREQPPMASFKAPESLVPTLSPDFKVI